MTLGELATALGVSRSTLVRYRRRDNWPGDDEDVETLREWVAVNRSPAGRPPAAETPSSAALAELKVQKLRAEIARIELQTEQGRAKLAAEVREGVIDEVIDILDGLRQRLERLHIDADTIEEWHEWLKDRQSKLESLRSK